jgi:hypothetical protein
MMVDKTKALDPPQQLAQLLHGDAKDPKHQKRVSLLLEDALEFLRNTAKTNDYFIGYSVPEIIHERLVLIGTQEDTADANEKTSSGLRGKPTLLGRLAKLELLLLGDPKDPNSKGAIALAKEIKNPIDLTDKSEDDEPAPQG